MAAPSARAVQKIARDAGESGSRDANELGVGGRDVWAGGGGGRACLLACPLTSLLAFFAVFPACLLACSLFCLLACVRACLFSDLATLLLACFSFLARVLSCLLATRAWTEVLLALFEGGFVFFCDVLVRCFRSLALNRRSKANLALRNDFVFDTLGIWLFCIRFTQKDLFVCLRGVLYRVY